VLEDPAKLAEWSRHPVEIAGKKAKLSTKGRGKPKK
jgi:hypothetical protein